MRALATLLLTALMAGALPAAESDADRAARQAQARWQSSPHGPMLERIIPPYLLPSRLPEPDSEGARLTARYCVQCHHLASPAMHHAEKWPAIVERMLPRMRGSGNMGPVMLQMMASQAAPSAPEAAILTAYLQRHAQARISADALPEAGRSGAWNSYVQACSQCHTVPEPRRHTRAEWPAVVARMERNMAWMNRVAGSQRDPREPQYRTRDIVDYLQRHARQ